QPGDIAAGDQQRADIGDQRSQVQVSEELPRLVLERGLPGQQLLVGRARHHTTSPARHRGAGQPPPAATDCEEKWLLLNGPTPILSSPIGQATAKIGTTEPGSERPPRA